MSKSIKTLVIGGGAAGMAAAITAAQNGAEVTVIEQLSKVGRKLLATGNGRCNFTNVNIDISKYHGSDIKFINEVLRSFGYEDTIRFFENLGLHYTVEEGRVYPASMQGSSVLDVLRYEMKSLGVVELCDTIVTKITKDNNTFILQLKDKDTIKGDRIILTTGGKANPSLGSKGRGYDLVKVLGHRIIEPFPSLVQLKLDVPFLKGIAGVRFNCKAMVEVRGNVLKEDLGEVLFTPYGISGIPILQLSRNAGEQLRRGVNPTLKLDLFPQMEEDELTELLIKRSRLKNEKPFDFSFVTLINKKLIRPILKEAGISDISMPCGEVTNKQLMIVSNILKNWTFDIIGTNSWSEAQVTAGGVNVSDINSRTMESKLMPGLFFAGEIVDVDGDCGGFNLQWAWATGHLAGLNVSK